MACEGYAPFIVSSQQDQVLDAILARPRPGQLAVLDLDGCLFDNRPRQLAIIHEYAGRHDLPQLCAVGLSHFDDWDQARTLRNAGLDADFVASIRDDLRRFWWKRFFSGEYVRLDHAMPGAVRLVRQLHGAGVGIVYLTGRDRTMHDGTLATLDRYGFPIGLPDTTLMTKPTDQMQDEDWKAVALPRIVAMGTPAVCMDNEPTNINLFAEAIPDALCVFVSTDHSPRPTEPLPQLPRIRGFLRTTDDVPGIEQR